MSLGFVLGAALVWDALWGELPNAGHPVAWVGRVIGAWQRRAPRRGAFALIAGTLFAVGLPLGLALAVAALLHTLAPWPLVAGLVALFLLQASFACKALLAAGARVGERLASGDLTGARAGLSWLCSREADELDAAELEAATVESLAENSSDSFVAPLFWLGVAGLPGVVFYRVANTADAMLGYRGDLELAGKAAARLDDLLNLIPARITGLAVVLASALVGLNPRGAARVLRRDRALTESPNAGWPMAAAAGALDMVLAKRGAYALGVGLVEPQDFAPGAKIATGIRLVRVASWLGAALAFGLGIAWHGLAAGVLDAAR